MKKRSIWASLTVLVLAGALVTGCGGKKAADNTAKTNFPTKEISLVSGYAPGGSSDLIDRALAQAMEKNLSKPVVVVNREGANGTVSLAEVAKNKADGYTLVHGVSGHFLTEPLINKGVRYKQEDFEFLMNLTTEPIVLTVSANSPYKTWDDLVKASKEKDIVMRYSTSGMGSLVQLSAAHIFQQGGIKAQPVPFKGGAPAVAAILGGHVEVGTSHPAEVLPHIKAGKLIPIIISSATRFSELPDTPTMKEKGFDVDLGVKKFIMAPKGLPANVKQTLTESIRKAVDDVEFKKKMADLHIMIEVMDAQQLENYINTQKPIIKKLVDELPKAAPKQ
ncbi:MAG: transporter substrate-binding protein [Anaerosporomusa subterranea]|jgi:tripartite-type tricarboxylate transporter receptor subunit TctC|nr:transporter substrate-binding protein [Anaerosporomusa subterranea]